MINRPGMTFINMQRSEGEFSLNQSKPAQNADEAQPEFGEAQVASLVAAFYRLVREDDLIGPMYPADDWSGAEQRLRDFLIFRFGGSDQYIRERGHPRLRMRHAPFKIGIEQRDRWLEIMKRAITETNVPKNRQLELEVFFGQVADFLRNV